MHPETLPPSVHISSTPIPLSHASTLLTTYLANSELHPHLHPDALITPTGVTFSSHGGPMGGVVMHNLHRVAAGLRGEYLEPERTPEPEDDDEDTGKKSKKGDRKGKRRAVEGEEGDAEDWQNMSEYEREEGFVEVGEVGDRSNHVQTGGEAPEVEVTGGPEGDGVEGGKKRKKDAMDGEGKVDKDARKAAKRERRKAERREKEKKRAEKAT